MLTHHHPDHVGAAAACAARYRVPVWAHPLTAQALAGRVEVRRPLGDGEELDLGPAPHGRGRWRLTALHTPGHAPGHLAFYEPDYRLLFAGDLLEDAVAHRAERERQLLDALTAGLGTVDEIAVEMYRGLPEKMMRFARLQVESGLEKLRREGRARQDGEAWRPTIA